MLFMIVERFRNGDPVPIYARFRDRGRMAPDGLRYVSSWVTVDDVDLSGSVDHVPESRRRRRGPGGCGISSARQSASGALGNA